MKYLDPKADLPFKCVFGEHPDLVMSLLNALLPLAPGQEISDIEYRENIVLQCRAERISQRGGKRESGRKRRRKKDDRS